MLKTKEKTKKIKTESNFGVLKTIIIAILIIVQFCFLIISALYLLNVFKGLVAFSFFITIIFCLNVLSSNRTGQIKATWIFFMLICFTFGWIIFILSNDKLMFGRHKKRYLKIQKNTDFLPHDVNISSFSTAIKNDCNYLQKNGNFTIYNSGSAKYFSSGESLFNDILKNLKMAKKFIFIEFFIVSDGILSNAIFNILKQKASQGVDVRIIYDDMGSHGKFKRKTKKQLAKHGIKLEAFNKLVPILNFALNYRDHRKIVVIDGETAYTGGTNLADEYINAKKLYGFWKDEGIKICGDCVNTFSLAFLRQWEFLTKKQQEYQNFLTNTISTISDISQEVVVPFVTGPDYKNNIARDMYENMIASATKKIYIMTPYLIPDETVVNVLKNKALSGVDVQIVLPEIADKKSVYLMSLDQAENLMQSGVKIWLMKNSFVHSKLLLTENACIVGSINMDQRSLYQQFESAVFTNNKAVMQDLQTDFEKTINTSIKHQIKRRGMLKKTTIRILRLISPLM